MNPPSPAPDAVAEAVFAFAGCFLPALAPVANFFFAALLFVADFAERFAIVLPVVGVLAATTCDNCSAASVFCFFVVLGTVF